MLNNIDNITGLLIQSIEEERNKFEVYRRQILDIAEIIPLSKDILKQAIEHEKQYNLSSQDAIVYSSIINHLTQLKPSKACFLNRNSKDFGNNDIVEALKKLNCTILFRFNDGYNFITSQI